MTTPFRYNPDLDDLADLPPSGGEFAPNHRFPGEAAPVTDTPRVAPLGETGETRGRECRCGRDGVTDFGQCAVREGWGALRPGTYCRRGTEQ
jgi:hypothetical protein